MAAAFYCGRVLDLSMLDLETLADALADQSAALERQWLLDSRTGEIVAWTDDAGIDGETPVEWDDLDPALIVIEPIPSYVWYQDMADFAERLSDERAGERLGRALDGGKGAFRRFRDKLHIEFPDLLTPWSAFRTARAQRRAVEWLTDNDLVEPDAAERFFEEHPEPAIP